MTSHRLLERRTVEEIETAVAAHLGRPWRVSSWTDLAARSSHAAAILRDETLGVFAKLASPDEARSQVDSELAGLRLLASSGIRVPVTIGTGRIDLPDGSAVLLFEALDEQVNRSTKNWRDIGRVLATLHNVRGTSYGADTPGFFGPLRLDNEPVLSTLTPGWSSMRCVACSLGCGPRVMQARWTPPLRQESRRCSNDCQG